MTIVECFERSPFENLISTLTSHPDKIVFVGEQAKMDAIVENHKKFLHKMNFSTQVTSRYISPNDLQGTIAVLVDILKAEKDCIFDVTGGEDLVLLAVGMVYEQYHQQFPIRIQRVDMEKGILLDCTTGKQLDIRHRVSLSVDDLVALHGGVIVPEQPQPSPTAGIDSIDNLWDIAKHDSSQWNHFVTYLNEFISKGNAGSTDTTTQIDLSQLGGMIKDYPEKEQLVTDYLNILFRTGLIEDLHCSYQRLTFRTNDPLVQRALKKAGNILELKVYFEARELQDNDTPYFSNCYLGVNIDWDGIVHSPAHREKDTRNEIDVVLMRGTTPVFISCKNGKIHEGEPYKLSVVAHRFGGHNAKKILLVTDFRETDVAKQSLTQRCEDMGIQLITEAATLTKQAWQALLKNMA